MVNKTVVRKALRFAAMAHRGQQRKLAGMPFIAHPFAVAMNLQRMDCEDSVVVAALLHDVVEDTAVTSAEIQEQFGGEVAAIVASCTELSGEQWETRKALLIETLRTAPVRAKVVAAADKLENLRDIQAQLAADGAEMWTHFSRGVEKQAWFFRSMATALQAHLPKGVYPALFAELQSLVDEVFDGVTAWSP